jgi:hypothetical protein
MLAPSRCWERHKGWGQGWGNHPTSQRNHWHQAEVGRGTKAENGGKASGQLPKAGQVVDPRAVLIGQRTAFKTELLYLAGEELTKQSCSWRAMQLLPGEKKQQLWTPALTILHGQADVPHFKIETNLVDRRTKYYSQTVRSHQSFHFDNSSMTGHLRNNSRTFTKTLNFL